MTKDVGTQTLSENNSMEVATQTLSEKLSVDAATQTDVIGWVKEEMSSAAKHSIIKLNDRIGDQILDEESQSEAEDTPTDSEEFDDNMTDNDEIDKRYKQIDNQFASGYHYITNVSYVR